MSGRMQARAASEWNPPAGQENDNLARLHDQHSTPVKTVEHEQKVQVPCLSHVFLLSLWRRQPCIILLLRHNAF